MWNPNGPENPGLAELRNIIVMAMIRSVLLIPLGPSMRNSKRVSGENVCRAVRFPYPQ